MNISRTGTQDMHLDMSMQKYDFGKEEHRNLSTL